MRYMLALAITAFFLVIAVPIGNFAGCGTGGMNELSSL